MSWRSWCSRCCRSAASAQETPESTGFGVKYIAAGVVYLDGGRAAGFKGGTEANRRSATSLRARQGAHKPAPPSSASVIATLRCFPSLPLRRSAKSVFDATRAGGRFRASRARGCGEQKSSKNKKNVSSADANIRRSSRSPAADPVVEEAARMPFRGRLRRKSTACAAASDSNTARFSAATLLRARVRKSAWWRGSTCRASAAPIGISMATGAAASARLSGSAVPATISDLINRTYTLSSNTTIRIRRWSRAAGASTCRGPRASTRWTAATSAARLSDRHDRGSLRRHHARSVFLRLQPAMESWRERS